MDGITPQTSFHYQQALEIWEAFCQEHRELFDLTCEEYLTLLASDIDKLESMLPLKEEIIARIGELEARRARLIEEINQSGAFAAPITRAGELLAAFAELERRQSIPALRNLNSLLVDIIQNIQEQNRKNQVFLNKAMLSLREVKQGFSGKKTFTTYGADGMTRALNR
jgi:flagellar biosynthesis/type III secretory pathway chaperone